ncbi:MAG: diguanylate cyclase [Anaerolineales bacterium]|nr:diguanylate cyclase [Anaerolineales bacterium]
MFEKHSAVMLLIEPEAEKILDANQAALDFYGYSKSKLCGMSLYEINTLPPEQVTLERQKALNEKRNYFIFPHKLSGGEERIVEVHSSPIVWQEKQVNFLIIQDITERVQAEAEREALLEIMQGSVVTQDLKDFLRLVHHSIAKVIYAENFFVLLYNKDTDLFEEVYSVDKFDLPGTPTRLKKSASSYVFRSGQPFLSTQARFDELVMQNEVEFVGTNSPSWLGVPLRTSSETIGVMVVQDYDYPNRYSEHDTEVLFSIAGQVALVVKRKQAENELRRAKDEIETAHCKLQQSFAREQQLARTDELTDINNNHSLLQLAEREFEVAMRYRPPLSMMFFDIDDFKQINDTYGHAIGDQALKKLIQVIRADIRSADVIGRYGGDEFIILLPQTSAQEALPLAERIHASVAAMHLDTDKGAITLTISIGIAQTIHNPASELEYNQRTDTVENLFLRADQAMYAAKQAGKNCTVIFDSK